MSNIAGLDSIGPNIPNSMANAFTSGCRNRDGTYAWSVNHGTVNTVTQHGTEHGTFNVPIPGFTSGPFSGDTLGAIFDGQISVYDGTALSMCTGSDTRNIITTLIYQTAGRFTTLKNDADFTGATSSFHWEGTYSVTVKQDSGKNCHFDAELTGDAHQ